MLQIRSQQRRNGLNFIILECTINVFKFTQRYNLAETIICHTQSQNSIVGNTKAT